MPLRLNFISMLPILILNHEKINTQVLVKTSKQEDDTWAFTLNNTTKNIYKIFLESYFSENTGKLLYREASDEFKLHPGIVTVTEKEIGEIISKHLSEKLVKELSVCVKQKYGPDLGFQNIQLQEII